MRSSLSLESIVKYLTYRSNPLRRLGIVGFKKAHLEADPDVHNKIFFRTRNKIDIQTNDGFKNACRRSLAQYLCQSGLYSNNLQRISAESLFLLALPFLILKIIFSTFLSNAQTKKTEVFVFELGDLNDIRDFFKIQDLDSQSPGAIHMGMGEWAFLLRALLKEPRLMIYPKLTAHLLRWFSYYGWVVKYRSPRYFCTFSEGIAASSVLTYYLNEKGIQHYNFSHGELFKGDCYSAFSDFNKYVTWGEHFKEIQVEKLSREEIFHLQAPRHFSNLFFQLRRNKLSHDPGSRKRMVAYVHSGFKKGSIEFESLCRVAEVLGEGWTLAIRPHPADRATWPQVYNDFQDFLLQTPSSPALIKEMPELVSMRESLSVAQAAVGTVSTALLEAWLSGCRVLYIPGVIKNPHILERHGKSPNVLHLSSLNSPEEMKTFFERSFDDSPEEHERIFRLFDFSGRRY